jgi:hypothetical protein
LQITFPFPCGPAAQLTPPCPEQQPLVASAKTGIENETAKNTASVAKIDRSFENLIFID